MRESCIRSAVALLFGASAFAQAPDVTASVVAGTWAHYGEANGFLAYSFRTTMCNIGDAPLAVQPYFDAPVVAKNLFRIAEGRIVQIGYGFQVIRICALNEPGCAACQSTACGSLGAGCADTSAISDGSIGWGKWGIDANRGEWPVIPDDPTGDPGPINGRIQVAASALGIPGAVYIAENQIISGHDQQVGFGANNVSWREADLAIPTSPASTGPTYIGEPAIFAWRAEHADVRIVELTVVDEGGPGMPGTFWLASRATDLGNGTWRYDYALQNTTSHLPHPSSRRAYRRALWHRSPLGPAVLRRPAPQWIALFERALGVQGQPGRPALGNGHLRPEPGWQRRSLGQPVRLLDPEQRGARRRDCTHPALRTGAHPDRFGLRTESLSEPRWFDPLGRQPATAALRYTRGQR